ncbi:PrsW family glutamic-type intramembrane protease [Leifsonia sp. NPDC058248]|uniref:PrsW family glutamic-type intramembrane protease n=1 Tax=Leifsonia sp. NPDC058248 TaxID=3346402 RepID=UPI0036DDB61A
MTYGYPPQLPPSGWYPDPQPLPQYRWWSGTMWTAYVHPPREPATVAVGGASDAAAGSAVSAATGRKRMWLGRFGGFIILGACAGIWVWLIGFSLILDAIAPADDSGGPVFLSPYLLVTGSVAVAASIMYTMAYRLRPADGLTASRLVIIALVGGTGATLLAIPVNSLIDVAGGGTEARPSALALGMAGVVEELAKILFVVLLAWRLPVKNARIGLFVGGAVGFGFSVIENLSYLEQAFALGAEKGNAFGSFIETVIVREVTGPFLHPVFTALLSAAVFAAARNGRFRITFGVIGTYLAVATAHGLFNSMFTLTRLISRDAVVAGLLTLLFTVLLLLGSGLAWLLVARRAKRTALAQEAAAAAAAYRAAALRTEPQVGPGSQPALATDPGPEPAPDARADPTRERINAP